MRSLRIYNISSRLRSLIIYNSQIFTRYCRYSRYSLDILSSRSRSLTIYNSQIFTSSKSFVSSWHCVTFCDPLICISETHILNIISDTLDKATLKNFLYNWVRATNNHMSLFVKQITSRGIFLCVPNLYIQMYCLTFFIIFHFFCKCPTSYPAVLQKVCC